MTVSIALFTRDLRVHDNPVLQTAASTADTVIPLFVLDTSIAATGYPQPNRASFLADCLQELHQQLRERGGRLVLRRGDVVEQVARLAEEFDAGEVHVAADVSAYARRREHALAARLGESRRVLRVHDSTITVVEPGALVPSGGGDHFRVFTPYFRRWTATPRRRPLDPPARLRLPRIRAGDLPIPADISAGTPAPELARGGERHGRDLLADWVNNGLGGYAEGQDDLAADTTSRLSPHLHFGSVSPTELSHLAGTASPGAQAFVRQLAWRDFHHQVLAARPDSARQDYRPRGDRWRRAPGELAAWEAGRTGYPIVDAAMRQLRTEGWMHNRARLVVGSFLSKTLYLDWRDGARHFLRYLVDGDIANNQLNWQWVAGTGTDSRPNRVLNPLLQAHRFDPAGDYVRRHLPELADVPGPAVHEPWSLPREQRACLDYPSPIVDLAEGRQRFLAARQQTSSAS